MFWRFLTAIIIVFWAVMTGLMIRDVYFPDHSRFAVVPVSMVFDLFLSEPRIIHILRTQIGKTL